MGGLMDEAKKRTRRTRLEKLTQEIARPREEERSRVKTTTAVLFRTGALRWAVDVRSTRGTALIEKLFPMPGVPPFVLGIYNYQGILLPILDLMCALAGAPPMTGRPVSLVILGHDEKGIALASEDLPGLRTIAPNEILQVDSEAAPLGGGVIAGKTVGGLYLLDGLKIPEDPRWRVDQSYEQVE